MARINHGPRRRRHREACLLIKQRPSPPVKVLLPYPLYLHHPPPPCGNCTKCSTLERFSLSTFKLFSHILLDLCFHFQSASASASGTGSAFFFGLFSPSSFLRPSRGLFCYFCQSQCQIAKALQLVDFCSFCEAFVADLAQQK